MSRGFVTIATGAERYFEIAENLLRSYHKFASVKYPFAIICDRKNNYTSEFDDVILLEKPNCNYLDKLQLYKYLPYDETIFIDADSLAYGDLDEWWNIFKNADDFSLFGYAWTDLNCRRGWFVPEGIREYKDKVTFIQVYITLIRQVLFSAPILGGEVNVLGWAVTIPRPLGESGFSVGRCRACGSGSTVRKDVNSFPQASKPVR